MITATPVPIRELVDPRLMASVEDLDLVARWVVEGFLHGLHRSPYVGFSVDFASHREYMPGDDLRHLNWKLYGRNDRLYIKQYDAETNVDLHLVLDVTGSMTIGEEAVSKLRYAALLAASLAHLASRQRDAVGMTLVAEQVVEHYNARGNTDHILSLLSALARQRPHPPANSPRVLHEAAELMPRRGLVVLISDLYYDTAELLSALDHFRHFGHDVLVFQILAPLERSLPIDGAVKLVDVESGEALETLAHEIRDSFTKAVDKWLGEIHSGCLARDIDHVVLVTDQPLDAALLDYLIKRAQLCENEPMGLSLIHAGFLAAGLAVGLPVFIHLLLRQKTRTVPIGSVRFLHQVVKEHRRRRRLRQWILLALRMLAVLLLALLFARPYWDESYRRGLETEVVLLIDRSASMGAEGAEGLTALERAVSKTREELKQVDENTVVHLALCDAAGVTEIPVEKLAVVQSSVAATDYGLALSWANDVLAASKRAHRKIVLFTDLQASGLPPARVPPLASGIEFRVEDVGEALRRNVAIAAVEPIHTEIHPQSQPTLRVTLRNHGPLAARKVEVSCTLARRASEGSPAGNVTAAQTVDIAAQSLATVELPLAADKDGLYQGEVTIVSDDALAIDNRRFVAFEARHPDRVLLVDGQEGRAIYNSETYYLETALRLRTPEAGGMTRSFEPERIVWEAGTGFPRLDGYRAIVLANVRRLSDEDGERLLEFVSGGGSLLVFAGDQVTSQSLAPLARRGLLPGEIASETATGKLRVDEWNAKHPALACFADPQQGDMRRVEYHTLLPLAKLADGATKLWQAGGHIAAAELAVGQGRIVYVGSTADRDWTELPRTRMYVPLMRQLAAHLTAQLAERSLAVHRLATKPDERLGIAPDKTTGNEGRWLVTNLDPRESALERITPEQFGESLGIAAATPDAAVQASLALTLPKDALRADEIWTAFVWMLLIVLAIETLLAGRVHA